MNRLVLIVGALLVVAVLVAGGILLLSRETVTTTTTVFLSEADLLASIEFAETDSATLGFVDETLMADVAGITIADGQITLVGTFACAAGRMTEVQEGSISLGISLDEADGLAVVPRAVDVACVTDEASLDEFTQRFGDELALLVADVTEGGSVSAVTFAEVRAEEGRLSFDVELVAPAS